ncbi:ABC transporter substrate-binding protein [Halanaerobium sp. MA284_MarDTE_T2]|uniref:ABC transporter substrate-binding protein n=1 Tax=Halanaerobium sp. MA284_MarDTE_T2 TaxID=2183913 RepID=UPI000DF19EF2|nr:sugar ABC transporter substrate-binding protein [Halanaerobium sp. MA284_MarDTE_T2]RCW47769.1 carbohydrate ABC transporter substrate-binding protein (CUT1 family) [Halanaerobium sp. MA284_MarDTE_T2]
MKKILFILIIIITVFSAGKTLSAEKTEIEFWTINLSPRFDEYFENLIENYERENPDINIIWEDNSFSAVKQKLLYRMAEDRSPDVVNLSPELMTSLVKEDLLYPVSNFDKDFYQDYYQGLWEVGVFNGKSYAFPWYLSTQIMMYNKEIFMFAGIEENDYPKNIDELKLTAEKIKENTGIYGFMPQIKIHHEFIKAGIELYTEKNGRIMPAFNTKKAVEILRWYQNLMQKDLIPADTLTGGYNLALERYINGELGILITGPQFIDKIKEESPYIYDVTAAAPLVLREGEKISAALMNVVIPKKSKNPEKAAEFAHYLTGAEAQQEFAEKANVLSSAKNAGGEDLKNKNGDLLKSAVREISKKQLKKAVDMTLKLPQADELIRVMDIEFGRAVKSKNTAEEAVNRMEKGWLDILNKGNETE